MKILIVDDEALARRRLASLLADCPANPPHRVSEAASSADALWAAVFAMAILGFLGLMLLSLLERTVLRWHVSQRSQPG